MPAANDCELTDDALAGPVRIWQRRRGHRYSLDDTATAWLAATSRPRARSVLDLGTGIGSVLLMLGYKLPEARLCGIEAQDDSVALLVRNVERSGFSARVQVLRGDLRDAEAQRALSEAAGGGFELITGTPPYQPLGRGSVSPDPQRAHARVELRGGVEAYVQAAARLLAPAGLFVTCADARTPERALRTAEAARLLCVHRLDVRPSANKPALFSVFAFERASTETETAPAPPNITELCARDEHGRRTAAALELRRFFDLPVPAHEAPSPRVRPGQSRRGAH